MRVTKKKLVELYNEFRRDKEGKDSFNKCNQWSLEFGAQLVDFYRISGVEWIRSNFENGSHCWLHIQNEWLIDITIDQFVTDFGKFHICKINKVDKRWDVKGVSSRKDIKPFKVDFDKILDCAKKYRMGLTISSDGCCFSWSTELKRIMRKKFRYVPRIFLAKGKFRSDRRTHSHYWLRIQNCIIDVTVDQFNNNLRKKNKIGDCYVGPDTEKRWIATEYTL